MKTAILSLAIAISFPALGWGIGSFEYSEGEVYKQQMFRKILSKKKVPSKAVDQDDVCITNFLKKKHKWKEATRDLESKLYDDGMISHSFTAEELLNMKTHPHLSQDIKGADRIITQTVFISKTIGFPHQLNHCRDYFSYDVKNIKIEDRVCRQVRFEREGWGNVVYFQTYCEDDNSIYLSF